MTAAINAMRPQDLHDQALLLREQCGVAHYLAHKDQLVAVPCPACGETERLPLAFRKYGYEHRECAACATLFVSPRPTDDALIAYYSDYEAPKFWTRILIETNAQRKVLQHAPRVAWLAEVAKRQGAPLGTLVDLGAGNGNFARAVADANLYRSVLALDVSEDCVTACKAQGLEARLGTLADLPDGSVDAVTFNDLIEHVFDPLALLTDCVRALAPGGLVMLATPSGTGFDFRMAREHTVNITPPEHIQYFNPSSIQTLMRRAGLEPLEVRTPGVLDVQIVKRLMAQGTLRLEDDAFLRGLLSQNDEALEASLQKFLQDNLLSSHMVALARKPG